MYRFSKIIIIMVALSMLFMLTACSEGTKNTNSNQQSQGTQQDDKSKQQPQQQTKQETQEVSEPPKDFKEWLVWVAENETGKESNLGKPRISSVYFLDEKQSKVFLSLWVDENLAASMMRDGLLVKSTRLLYKIFNDQRASEVTLEWLYPMKNANGQETEIVIMLVRMKRETASKINWKEFRPFDLPTVADKYTVHQQLQ